MFNKIPLRTFAAMLITGILLGVAVAIIGLVAH